MLSALLLLKSRPTAAARPFHAERFEYVVASREQVLVRLSGHWRTRDAGAPARVILEARTGRRSLTFVPLPEGADAAGSGASEPGWRASFSVPLEVAEHPAATFTLQADRTQVVLPRLVERPLAGGAAQGARRLTRVGVRAGAQDRLAGARNRAGRRRELRVAELERELRVEARRALTEARVELEALRAEAERRSVECSELSTRLAANEEALARVRIEKQHGAHRVRAVRRRVADLDETLSTVQAERDAERTRAQALTERQSRLEAEARSRGIRVGDSKRRIAELRDALVERSRSGGVEADHDVAHQKLAELRVALEAARSDSARERRRAAVLAGQMIGVPAARPPEGRRARRAFELPRPADRRAREVARAERRLAEIKAALERALERDGASH